MELDTAKGTRDIEPREQAAREYITNVLVSVFKSYGFQALDTPLIERRDVLAAKFAAGEESDALKETYTLEDNGGRELGLRFDLTVPLSRYIAMNRTLKLPFKRYQIGKVYRDAPVKVGRYREFTQMDVDIIGSKDLSADLTCLQLALDGYTKIGLDVTIKVNNRTFLQELMNSYGIDEQKFPTVVVTVDKLDKIDREGVAKELIDKGVAESSVNKLLDELSTDGSNEEKLSYFQNKMCAADNPEISNGIDQLKKLFSLLNDGRLVFDPTLVRGLGYYTGTVFEVFDATGKLKESIGGGGRYDKLIGEYLANSGINSDRDYPAVGMSFGIDRIIDVLKMNDALPAQATATQVFVIPMNTNEESFALAKQLREQGVAVDMDMMNRGLSKNLNNCNAQQIPFALIVGEDELASGKFTLKNLVEGNEEQLTIEEIASKVKG